MTSSTRPAPALQRGGVCLVLCVLIHGVLWLGSVRADCIRYQDYLHWVGSVDLVNDFNFHAVVGTHAFIVGSGELKVVDISAPESPEVVGVVDNLQAHQITASGNYAYATHIYDGLIVIDISTPESPQVVGSLDMPDAEGIAISGNYAYIGGGYGGTQVIDISDPTSPQLVASVPTPDYSYDVAVSGNHLYIAGLADGLQVVDISDPEAPVDVGGLPTAGMAYYVTVSGNYAYMTLDSGFQIVDVSDPSTPVAMGITSSTSLQGVSALRNAVVSGNHAFAAASWGGLVVIDVSSPASPSVIARLESPSANTVTVCGNHAWVLDRNRLHAADISSLASVGMVGNVPAFTALGVAVSGHHAFVANGSAGLNVVDVSTPQAPVIVGVADTPGFARNVAVAGSFAYVADGGPGLTIVDISTPASPSIQTTLATGNAFDVKIVGNLAYVAANNTFKVVLISGPGSPAIVGSVPITATRDVAVAGNLAYVAADGSPGQRGLYVVDVSNPTMPAVLGNLDLSGTDDVAVSGAFAYVAATQQVYVVDVSTPASPALVRTLPMVRNPNDLLVQGHYLYVADGYITDGTVGVHVLDIAAPGDPVHIGDVNTFDAHGIAVSGDYAYVADGPSLTVVPAQCGGSPLPVLITRFVAQMSGRKVAVSWDVWSDEGLDRYTLYRSEGEHTRSVVIAEGRFDPATRSYLDAGVKPGGSYRYELVVHTQAGDDIRSQSSTVTVPRLVTALGGAFPNPFRARTSIEYTLGERSRVTLGIYDVSGRLVARLDAGDRDAGSHRVEWDGRDGRGGTVASGVYFYRIEGSREVVPKRMILIR